MSRWKKYLSYLWLVKDKVSGSTINPYLELRWEDGQKVLNTRNANYSYGSLQKVMRFILRQLAPEMRKAQRILILGLGAGGVVQLLRKEYGFKGELLSIEIDAEVIRLAREEFGLEEREKVIAADAYEWVKTAKGKFDIVIDDLFIDREMAHGMLEPEFYGAVKALLQPGGVYVRNAIFRDAKQKDRFEVLIKEHFATVWKEELNPLNKVYFGRLQTHQTAKT